MSLFLRWAAPPDVEASSSSEEIAGKEFDESDAGD